MIYLVLWFSWLVVSSGTLFVSSLKDQKDNLCTELPEVYIMGGYVERLQPENMSMNDCVAEWGNTGNMVWAYAALTMFDHKRNKVTPYRHVPLQFENHVIPDLLVMASTLS